MLYTSTRGNQEMVSAARAITRGLADDGGLYVPQQLPVLSLDEIMAIGKKNYTARAAEILGKFLSDFSADELGECVKKAYTKAKFGDEPAPLKHIDHATSVLELWHGPTSAFKDMALQLLPHLLIKSLEKTGENHKVVILAATSGDTGKAALEGFANVEGTEIIVFYPEHGVSDIQKLQMSTQQGNNVKVFGIQGNFDDAQRGVKDIFGNVAMAEKLEEEGYIFSSANSINWGRLVPQIVYYFSAYVDAVRAKRIKAGEKINFAVPTGNFGNILAGYYAKMMGLPVERFICASNSNNVLTEFLSEGQYDRRREFFKTISPSMDILVSSNLERLLYHVCGKDAQAVASYMQTLKEKGCYKIRRQELLKVRDDFFGAWVDEYETKETIARVFSELRYVMDTHTAVAWRALEKYRIVSVDGTYSVELSTASPYKFADSVLGALGEKFDANDPFALLHRLKEISGIKIPEQLAALEKSPQLHDEVISVEEMEMAVLKNLI